MKTDTKKHLAMLITLIMFILSVMWCFYMHNKIIKDAKPYCGNAEYVESKFIDNEHFVFCRSKDNSIFVTRTK